MAMKWYGVHTYSGNDENVIILDNPEIAKLYIQEFERDWSQGSDPDPANIKCE